MARPKPDDTQNTDPLAEQAPQDPATPGETAELLDELEKEIEAEDEADGDGDGDDAA